MIEVISSAIAAGETKTFHIRGEYFEILEAAYPVDALMLGREGQQLSIMRNAEASYYSKPGAFASLQITSANAQVVRFFVGSGDAGTRKLSGVVQVVDGGKARTLANQAYMGAVTQAALASNRSVVGLLNLYGAQKYVSVKAYSLGATAAGVMNVSFYHNYLTNQLSPYPKLGGGNSGGVKLTSSNSPVSMAGLTLLDCFYVQAVQTVYRVLQEPIVLKPGMGIVIESTGTCDITAGFEWVEESI